MDAALWGWWFVCLFVCPQNVQKVSTALAVRRPATVSMGRARATVQPESVDAKPDIEVHGVTEVRRKDSFSRVPMTSRATAPSELLLQFVDKCKHDKTTIFTFLFHCLDSSRVRAREWTQWKRQARTYSAFRPTAWCRLLVRIIVAINRNLWVNRILAPWRDSYENPESEKTSVTCSGIVCSTVASDQDSRVWANARI